ncbi:MAG: hypothetical protein ACO2PN_15635 [Pyrobaculum sp.]|jgi:hypothetical protein
MELWEYYREAWKAEAAYEAAVPAAWTVRGGAAYIAVKFPKEVEPSEKWAKKTWETTTWVFGNGLFGIEVACDDGRFTVVACPQHGEKLAEVKEVYITLNTEPAVSLQIPDGVVQRLRGWAAALGGEAVKRKAVERARRGEYCR